MNIEIHPSTQRGHANHGWLQTWHSFSFADWYDPLKIHFGVLRVLNDDTVAPGNGFDLHPHNDMEIITIPLEGTLTHTDSTGNRRQLVPGEVQVMSAGKGIFHSEHNHDNNKTLKLLQIWIYPRQKSLEPSYDQKKINFLPDGLTLLVSPDNQDQSLKINQDAWIWNGCSNKNIEFEYKVKKQGNGLYIFVIEGEVQVADSLAKKRDALAIKDTEKIKIAMAPGSRFLIFDLPMTV